MLQAIRDRLQSWIAWLFIVVICAVFALWGVNRFGSGSGRHAWVAKVNGTPILRTRVNHLYERLRDRMLQQLGPEQIVTQSMSQRLRKEAGDQLILSEVLNQHAMRSGYRVSEEAVQSFLQNNPAFQTDGHFSRARFNAVLRRLMYSPEQFFTELQGMLLSDQIRWGLLSSAFVLPGEVEKTQKLVGQTRDLHYVTLPYQRFLGEASVSQQQIADYYVANKSEFRAPPQVKIAYLKLSLNDLVKELTAHFLKDKKSLNAFYRQHKDRFRIKGHKHALPLRRVKKRVATLLAKRDAVKLFAERKERLADLVFSNPENLEAASQALKLPINQSGWILKKEGAVQKGLGQYPVVLAASFSEDVLKNGNNSDPIALDSQTVIVLRKLNYRPSQIQPLSQVRGDIDKLLREKQVRDLAEKHGQAWLKKLRKGRLLSSLAKESGMKIVRERDIHRATTRIPTQLAETAFQLPHPQRGAEPVVGGIPLRNEYIVVQVDAVHPGKTHNEHQAKLFKTQLVRSLGGLDYSLYVDALRENATVVGNGR